MKVAEIWHDETEVETNVALWCSRKGHSLDSFYALNGENALPDSNTYDLYFLHGGEQHLWDRENNPFIPYELEFLERVLKQGKVVIGFCLGSQLLAESLGGTVGEMSEMMFGFQTVINRQDKQGHPLLNNLGETFTTFFWHSDHYKTGDETITLGSSILAENSIITHPLYKAAGFQFHPEYTLETIKLFWEQNRDEIGRGDYINPDKMLNRYLKTMPPTYSLFEQLIHNSLQWFQTRG